MITIEAICAQAEALPCSPGLLPKAVQLMQSEEAQLADLEHLILMDTGLSAAVLKMANSPAFASGRSFDSISEAVLRLGFRQTYRIVVAVLGGKWIARDSDAFGWTPGDFCRHSFTVACASRKLAQQVDPDNADLAYTAGLFHDVGKLALAFFASEALDEVRDLQAREGCVWSEAEARILGFTHLQVSAKLLTDWHFPDNLIAVALHYEYPESAPQQHARLVALVHLAKHLAVQTGIGGGDDAFYLNADARAAELLNVSEEAIREVVPGLVEDLRQLLGGRIIAGAIDF
jgi:putative nucleotidyltransferase with HDIG domain